MTEVTKYGGTAQKIKSIEKSKKYKEYGEMSDD
jgi:hypothetical protein